MEQEVEKGVMDDELGGNEENLEIGRRRFRNGEKKISKWIEEDFEIGRSRF